METSQSPVKERLEHLLATNATLQFVEPHSTGGRCLVSIHAQDAAAAQQRVRRESSASDGYPTLADALCDFIVIHWAYEERDYSRLYHCTFQLLFPTDKGEAVVLRKDFTLQFVPYKTLAITEGKSPFSLSNEEVHSRNYLIITVEDVLYSAADSRYACRVRAALGEQPETVDGIISSLPTLETMTDRGWVKYD